jgi:hypothetical protein
MAARPKSWLVVCSRYGPTFEVWRLGVFAGRRREFLHLASGWVFGRIQRFGMAAKFENPRRGNRHVTPSGPLPRRLARGASERQRGDEIGAGRHAGWIQSGADGRSGGAHDSKFAEKRADVYRPWLEVAKHCDYMGVQMYSRSIVGTKDVAAPAGAAFTQVGWEYDPECVEHSKDRRLA